VQSTPSIRAGDVAVVAGPGPIGLLTLQVLKASGAKVIVLGVEADSERLAAASALGADAVINVGQTAPLAVVQQMTVEGLGADTVYECSGAEAAAQGLLQLVRRAGCYVQIGIFGRPVAWDADQIVYRELVVRGTNASTPASWLRALALLDSGKVQTARLITDVLPLTAWEQAIVARPSPGRIKVIFTPD
jgi:L-iditol 2-dehydrogenase